MTKVVCLDFLTKLCVLDFYVDFCLGLPLDLNDHGQPGPQLFGNEDKNYGLEFGVLTDKGVPRGGLGSAGTFDWGGHFNTQYFADPQEETIGVLMKQAQGGNDDTGWKFHLLVGQCFDD